MGLITLLIKGINNSKYSNENGYIQPLSIRIVITYMKFSCHEYFIRCLIQHYVQL